MVLYKFTASDGTVTYVCAEAWENALRRYLMSFSDKEIREIKELEKFGNNILV